MSILDFQYGFDKSSFHYVLSVAETFSSPDFEEFSLLQSLVVGGELFLDLEALEDLRGKRRATARDKKDVIGFFSESCYCG